MASEQKLSYERALEILGLEEGATKDDIKRAYKNLARLCHPDKSKDLHATRKFQELSDAYRVLICHDGDGNEQAENCDFNVYENEDNDMMFFELLQEYVFRMRFASRVIQLSDASGYSRRYASKSHFFQDEREDTEFYNRLRKKQTDRGDMSFDADELDPDEVVKKYETMEEWEKAKKSKKRAKLPRPMNKKQLSRQQFMRDKQMIEIREQLLKDNEKVKTKLDKLSKKRQDALSTTPTFDSVSFIDPLLFPIKKPHPAKPANSGPRKSSANLTPTKKVVSHNPPTATIVIRKSIEKKAKKEVKEPKLEFSSRIVDEQRQVITSQLERRKTSLSLKEENAQPLNYAKAAAMKPVSLSDWEYATTYACATDNHLIPTTIDEEEKMVQQAIAISIEEEKRQQQRDLEFYRLQKAQHEPEPKFSAEKRATEPIHFTYTNSSSSSSSNGVTDTNPDPITAWEKFGVRPKRDFHRNMQMPSTTPMESDETWQSEPADDEKESAKKDNELTTPVKDFFQNAPKLDRNQFPPERIHFAPRLVMEDLDSIDEETPSQLDKPINSSDESIVPDLDSSSPNYSPLISPLLTPQVSPEKFEPVKTPPGLPVTNFSHSQQQASTHAQLVMQSETETQTPSNVSPVPVPVPVPVAAPHPHPPMPLPMPMPMPYSSYSSYVSILPQINPMMAMPYLGMGMMYPGAPPLYQPAIFNPMFLRMPYETHGPYVHPPGPGMENMARLEGGGDEVMERKLEEIEEKLKRNEEKMTKSEEEMKGKDEEQDLQLGDELEGGDEGEEVMQSEDGAEKEKEKARDERMREELEVCHGVKPLHRLEGKRRGCLRVQALPVPASSSHENMKASNENFYQLAYSNQVP